MSLKEYYDSKIESIQKVYGVFKDFFGEDKVDLQGVPEWEEFEPLTDSATTRGVIDDTFLDVENCEILVYYPEVTVTNEREESTTIHDIYVKVSLRFDGTIGPRFTINKATFTRYEYEWGYVHSHAQRKRDAKDVPGEFKMVCTGSGPINSTMEVLRSKFDLAFWRLYCYQLDKFLHIESLAGIPYCSLIETKKPYGSSINTTSEVSLRYSFPNNASRWLETWLSFGYTFEEFKDFFEYVAFMNNFKYNKLNIVGITATTNEFIISITNMFIQWYKNLSSTRRKELEERCAYNILIPAITDDDGKFKVYNSVNDRRIFPNSSNYTYIGGTVCKFKGQDIKLKVTGLNYNVEDSTLKILDPTIMLYIYNLLLKALNI